MSAEQKTSHRGFTIITVLERLSRGRARLSAKVLASDEDRKRRLGGKKLLQAKRWFDHFADDLVAPVIAGLKHTIDLELAAAAKAMPKTLAKPAVSKSIKSTKTVKAAKPAKLAKPAKAVKSAKPEKAAKADKSKKAAKAGKAVKTTAATKLARGASVGNGAPAAVGGAKGVALAKLASAAKPVVSGGVAKTRKRAAPSASVGTPAPKPLKKASGRSTT